MTRQPPSSQSPGDPDRPGDGSSPQDANAPRRAPGPLGETLSPESLSLSWYAPSYRAPMLGGPPATPPASGDPAAQRAASPAQARQRPAELAVGEVIDEFEILGKLGEGAFGNVYLARQMSLERLVALKVTANLGAEGRTMARLEHEYIVQVFSERVDQQWGYRLLCMQFVPGTTLESLIRSLAQRSTEHWSGTDVLSAVDRLARYPVQFDPASLQDREVLHDASRPESVCWYGSRLAKALAYAHQQGVLHRDLKPGNILINPYGRPFLVDFNLSTRRVEMEQVADLFGGTLAYMAPEHLEAFHPELEAGAEVVTEQSDIYALGLVLWELATGRLPFATHFSGMHWGDVLRSMIDERRQPPVLPAGFPPALGYVLSRCLQPVPSDRYASAAELAWDLEGCQEFLECQSKLECAEPFVDRFRARPFLWLTLLGLAPHVVGSLVNISYNFIRIVGHLSQQQQELFQATVIGYNVTVYPLCLLVAASTVVPVWRVWRRWCGANRAGRVIASGSAPRGQSSPPGSGSPEGSDRDMPLTADELDAARRQCLRFPRVAALLACAGWFPGALLFPLVLDLGGATRLDWHFYVHFLISFSIAGLIALTYSMLLVQLLVVCVLYPQLWAAPAGFTARAAEELRPARRRLGRLQILAGMIPLSAAIMMVAIGPQEFSSSEYNSFRFLVSALIVLGVLGFQMAVFCTSRLGRALQMLSGGALGH